MSGFRGRQSFGSKRPSKDSDAVAFVQWRVGTTDAILNAADPVQIAHRYRITVKEAEYGIQIEKQRRAARAAR